MNNLKHNYLIHEKIAGTLEGSNMTQTLTWGIISKRHLAHIWTGVVMRFVHVAGECLVVNDVNISSHKVRHCPAFQICELAVDNQPAVVFL